MALPSWILMANGQGSGEGSTEKGKDQDPRALTIYPLWQLISMTLIITKNMRHQKGL